MKKTLLAMLAVAAMAASSYGQGTILFANGSGDIISLNGVAATAANSVKAQLWYAPVGTTDVNLFQPLATLANVGTPLAGRFSAGTLTIPGIAPAGGSVAAIIRAFNGADWATSQGGNLGRGQSGIFTIDTGDPTTTPAGTPTSTAGLFGPVNVIVPEPSSMALAGIGAASLLLFRRRK
jgi:hypothetical protein